ncbi:MAG: WD40 repeat domain-containing protein, partial [Microcystaceae cyanobacterium]
LPYLQQGMLHFGEIQDLLERQFERLSLAEQQVMYWLAVNRDAVSLAELQEDLISEDVKRHLIGAAQSLHRRNLLERSEKRLLLQPVVLEYVTNRLARGVCEEIVAGQPNLLRTHALIKAQSQNYIRQAQVRCILRPVMDGLLAALGSTQSIKHKSEQILTTLRKTAPLQPGYVGGNLFNLLGELTGELNEIDGSYLTIRQAYLQDINLHSSNLSHANLEKCLFTETFGSINSVAFSSDGQRLVGGGSNGDIRVWDARTHQLLLTCKGHTHWVQSVTCSPDSQIFASGSHDRTVRLWDIHTGNCLKTLSGHTNAINSVAFSPDGKMLASGGDYTVRFWDIDTGKCLKSLKSDDGDRLYAVRSVAFSSDGQTLASGYSEPTIRLWNVKSGQCWKTLSGHQGWIWSVAFSRDGKILASGGDGTTIVLWDVHTGECLKTLSGHINILRSVAFSQDGRM